MSLRAAFIGCVEFSAAMLQRLLQRPELEIVGIVSREQSAINSDFVSLRPIAQQHGIPCLCVQGNDQKAMADWLQDKQPEVIFCLGWSYLLGSEILQLAPHGVIGYHPTLLPQNRGRHPIIWALALGLEQTGSTFFRMDEGADSGPIIDQQVLPIGPDDDARALYDRLIALSLQQLDRIAGQLQQGQLPLQAQDHSRANYWRKRGKADGLIDWRMPATGIHNLVRALARPYPGAHCLYRGKEISVWRSQPSDTDHANAEPGKVLALHEGTITVKCGTGSIVLLEHELDPLPAIGSYL